MKAERIIIGIDPGTVVMGYGVIEVTGSKIKLLAAGVLKLDKDGEHYDRLKKIFDTLLELFDEYKPDELAIEEPFFGKNVQSMLKLGRAQGVSIAAALHRRIPVFGYSPRKIKQSVTGRGAASKEQVSKMLQQLLKFEEAPTYLDATDALGVAVCHFFQNKLVITESSAATDKKKTKNVSTKSKNYTGWTAFISENPERVKKKKE
jgi:crossover junction endodeoxyribonuclease RuvC